MMNDTKLLFIGGGNMASALIGGLIADGIPAQNITVAEPDEKKRAQLAALWNIHTHVDNQAAAAEADVVIIAVKPQIAKSVCQTLASTIKQQAPLVLSIAAGIRHQSMQSWLGEQVSLVRTMPNTPAMLQAGATGLYAGENVLPEQRDIAESIMRAVGITEWVDNEALLDAVTALSGSGPAYFFLFMEAMANTAKNLGLPEQTARLLTTQTALGAARMAMESPDSLAELRKKVTSPGGTTEQAINTFESGDIRQLVEQALTAAKDKSIELSSQFGAE